jgi:hypothetical protein
MAVSEVPAPKAAVLRKLRRFTMEASQTAVGTQEDFKDKEPYSRPLSSG